MLWHIVVSQGRIVLAVFGAALLSRAQECARTVEHSTGFPARVEHVTGQRPSVGKRVDGGFFVMTYGGGCYTSIAWYGTREAADSELARILARGAWSGMRPFVEPCLAR